MEKRRVKYKEIRILIKEPIWEKLKENLKSSKYVTINDLVRNFLYKFAEGGDVNEERKQLITKTLNRLHEELKILKNSLEKI